MHSASLLTLIGTQLLQVCQPSIGTRSLPSKTKGEDYQYTNIGISSYLVIQGHWRVYRSPTCPISNLSWSILQWVLKVKPLILVARREILYLVEHHATVIIVGETGSGKTTQIPQYLLEAGWCSRAHSFKPPNRDMNTQHAQCKSIKFSRERLNILVVAYCLLLVGGLPELCMYLQVRKSQTI